MEYSHLQRRAKIQTENQPGIIFDENTKKPGETFEKQGRYNQQYRAVCNICFPGLRIVILVSLRCFIWPKPSAQHYCLNCLPRLLLARFAEYQYDFSTGAAV